MNTIKSYQALCDGMASREFANGAEVVEWVIVLGVVVGLGVALVLLRNNIQNFLNTTGNNINNLLTNLSSTIK